MKLSQIGELYLLEQIRKRFFYKSKDVILGIGDDAAVLKPQNKNLVVTTDMMVEGVHFDLRFITSYQLGFKLVSVNVSDIYAMGGKPYYLFLDIAVNKNTSIKFLNEFFHGVEDAMHLYKTKLIGGDVSSAHQRMSLSAMVIGYGTKYIKRSGACVGDKIYVTGTLGDSACGLDLLRRIKKKINFVNKKYIKVQESKSKGLIIKNPENKTLSTQSIVLKELSWNVVIPLFRRHLLPKARNPEKFIKHATSMIDISDGLLIDLSRICTESKVGARIYLKNIPLSTELKKVASHLSLSPIHFALSGGEDYELLFTAPAKSKVNAFYIGDITKSEKVIVDLSGREKPFSAEGYQHFIKLKKCN